MKSFKEVIEAAKEGGARKLVVASVEKTDIDLLGKAAGSGLIIPCIIGDEKAIKSMIDGTLLAEQGHEIINEKNPEKALTTAVELVREGHADILMQGTITHQAFMDAISDTKKGLRTGKKGQLVSYVSVFQ